MPLLEESQIPTNNEHLPGILVQDGVLQNPAGVVCEWKHSLPEPVSALPNTNADFVTCYLFSYQPLFQAWLHGNPKCDFCA